MTRRPQSPFRLSANPAQAPQRNKDNADPRHEPKVERKPAPNLAPGGSVGIRLGLPANTSQKTAKRFELGKTGDLNKEFKPIAQPSLAREPGRER